MPYYKTAFYIWQFLPIWVLLCGKTENTMRILIAEDESSVATMLNRGLTEQGYIITLAVEGKMAVEMIEKGEFDLIILDIMLPGINGFDILKHIRSIGIKSPVIALTALGSTENIIEGLNNGADDYLVKPFKFDELLARIHAVTRRASSAIATLKTIFRFEDIVVDDDAKKVTRAGKDIALTATEYRLLLYLLQNPNKVLSRELILENVWGINFDLGTNVVDVYINYLRKKIDRPPHQQVIQTVIGMGYVLRKSE